MHTLIDEVFRKKFSTGRDKGREYQEEKDDSAVIPSVSQETELAFTTDSYVINPIFFPGGDIGKLAVCGTINDLAVVGAEPRYMACGFIIEEGLGIDVLEKIAGSMAEISGRENLRIVTGDIKVVEKGSCDKIFINTSGIGVRNKKVNFSKKKIVPGDKILINGSIGEHGIAILVERGEFHFHADIVSDCAPLSGLTGEICNLHTKVLESGKTPPVKFMRDPTRGGFSTTLNEIVEETNFGIVINEKDIPVREEVKAACEILGLDPLLLANEGKVVVIIDKNHAEDAIEIMRSHPLGTEAKIVGEVIDEPAEKVLMKTKIGGRRIIEMMAGDQLPRIC